MSLIKEFKEFALKGNVVDMAVGIIIGAAFGKIVSSLVNDVVMPPLGYLLNGVDFSSLKLILQAGTATSPEVSINYGLFINTLISFTVISICIFAVIKAMNQLKQTEKKKAVTTKCPECMMDIPVDAKKCGHCTTTL